MIRSESTVALSRSLIALLGLIVWGLAYLDVKCAYRLFKGTKKIAIQLLLVLSGAGMFVLQVNLMNDLLPADSRGVNFFIFVMIECGGGLLLMFWVALREKARKEGRNFQVQGKTEM